KSIVGAGAGDFVHWSNNPPISSSTFTSQTACPLAKAFGLYLAGNIEHLYSWTAYTAGDATRNTDLSGAVLAYERKDQLAAPSEVRVVVDNRNGQHNNAAGLVRGASLTLNEGYVTALGAEQLNVATNLIESWYQVRAPGQN